MFAESDYLPVRFYFGLKFQRGGKRRHRRRFPLVRQQRSLSRRNIPRRPVAGQHSPIPARSTTLAKITRLSPRSPAASERKKA